MSIHRHTSKNLGTTARLGFVLAGALFFQSSTHPAHAAGIGLFESSADIGKIELKGSAEYLAGKAQYRISGSGKNMWFAEDAFQFLSKKLAGDLVFSLDVGWEAKGKENHRKVGAMVRQTLAADSPYVDVAVHGDGLIEMQYRIVKGGTTLAARTPIQAPATVKLERDGDIFTASVSKAGGPFQTIGAVSLALPDPVYVGLAVCAHNATNLETALVSNVKLENRLSAANEKRVRETSLETLDIATSERKIVYRDLSLFEAPNWSRDGKLFYFNRAGSIWTLPVAGGEPTKLNTGVAIKNNNDHGLSFDGQWLAISSGSGEKGSQIYVVPATGGEACEITPTGPSYWHGWSPDGKTLAYCAKRNDNYDVYTIPAAGGTETRLTEAEGLDDGPEYTADGSKIYFHSERAGGVPKIFRMNPDGSAQEQVTFDEPYADWFPHPSPDGKWLVFVSFDKSVKGHPANQNVVLRLMPLAGGKPKVIATLFGGQGTINVPSWSPDSTQIAFVSYRHILTPTDRTKEITNFPIDPFKQNARLGRGINIRRMEELDDRHYQAIKDAGFQHIRIPLFPFKYMKGKTGFDIQPVFFTNLDTAIRRALARDLVITLDLHEHKEMRKDPIGTKEKFIAAWSQIAPHCKDYPNQVLLEIANEPPMKPELWNDLYPQALKIIRNSNPLRTVLLGPPIRGNHIPYLKDLHLPEDDQNLIVTIHYYDPFAFTHQGVPFSEHFKNVSGVTWSGTEEEKKTITETFDFAQKWSTDHHRPINMGEFGTGYKGDLEARIRWTSFVARQMEARHWSWTYFEFDQPEFGIYDKTTGKWLDRIRDVLLQK